MTKSALQHFSSVKENGRTFMPGMKRLQKQVVSMQVHEKRLLNKLEQKQKDFLFTGKKYTLQNDLQHNERVD